MGALFGGKKKVSAPAMRPVTPKEDPQAKLQRENALAQTSERMRRVGGALSTAINPVEMQAKKAASRLPRSVKGRK